MTVATLLGALIELGGSGHYVSWGRLSISLANLTVVGVMVAVFVLAILLPHPRRPRQDGKG
jgi:hypothetical protein